MIINRIWTSVMIHVYYHEGTLSLSQMSMPYSLCFCDTCNIQVLIIGISIPSSISLPTFPFTCSRDIPSPCLVTCCNIGWISLSGPEYLLSHGWENPTLDGHSSTYLFGIPKRHLFSHPVTWWRLMQSKQPPDVVIMLWPHGLRNRLQHFLLL
jgi:hypothetical protein